jgi:hypothetical protein
MRTQKSLQKRSQKIGVEHRPLSAIVALARAEAAGVRLQLRPGGTVRVEAAELPPADVLADLRQWRDHVARLLTAREGQHAPDHDDLEGQAMAQHDAASPSARPHRPPDSDPLRDGLLLASRMRPPAWSADTPPSRGAWCGCCGCHAPKAGVRWWQPLHSRSDGLRLGPGWRCWIWHPPRPAHDVKVVQT